MQAKSTLLEVNGLRAVLPLLFPVVVALLPLLIPRRRIRILAAVLLFGFSVVAAMSIGLFYLPAAITMLIAACVRHNQSDLTEFA